MSYPIIPLYRIWHAARDIILDKSLASNVVNLHSNLPFIFCTKHHTNETVIAWFCKYYSLKYFVLSCKSNGSNPWTSRFKLILYLLLQHLTFRVLEGWAQSEMPRAVGNQIQKQGRMKGWGRELKGNKAVQLRSDVWAVTMLGVKVVAFVTIRDILICDLMDCVIFVFTKGKEVHLHKPSRLMAAELPLETPKFSCSPCSKGKQRPSQVLISAGEVKGHVTLLDKTRRLTDSLEMSRFWKVPDVEKNWKRQEWKIPLLASCSPSC